MDEDKAERSKSSDENRSEKLNEELKQTFPASDPPSHSRPGHERDSEK